MISNLQQTITNSVSTIGNTILLWVGVISVLNGEMTLGSLLTFNALLIYFLDPMKNLINLQPQMQTAIVAAERLSEILELEPEDNNQNNSKLQPSTLLKTLKLHIGMGLDAEESEDKSLDIQIRIAEIDAEFKAMVQAVSAQTADSFDESRATTLMNEKNKLLEQLEQISASKQKRESAKSRLDKIYTILDGLKNHPMAYDDRLIRQILECVIVESKEQIKVVFIGGLEVTEQLN